MVSANHAKNVTRQQFSLAQSKSCAIVIDASGQIVDQSPSAKPLLVLWETRRAEVQRALNEALDLNTPSECYLEHGDGAKLWLTVVPQEGVCLLLARDSELVEKMAEALLESRVLLKSLLDNAVDLSFEVGLDGLFRFISPADAFGMQADSWLGKPAARIFWPHGNAPARSPFSVKKKTSFDAVAVEIEGTEKRQLAIVVEPSVDKQGTLTGVRGTCRDVTARIQKERAARQDHLKISVQQRITQILNASENAQELLESASRELMDVLRADLVWSVVKYRDGLVPVSLCGDNMQVLDLEGIWRDLAMSSIGVHEIEDTERNHLAIRLERGGSGMGMVIISRDTKISPWSTLEKQFLDDIGDVLTAAFGKADLIDKLYRLSGKDELTDLLNRRAFKEVVERRLKHQRRTGSEGCFVFIDLDHFKEVNDTLGHKAGDEAIILVGGRLQSIIRPSDYAGRFGGDEFVLWIEDADEETAAKKAQQLLDYMPTVRDRIGNPDLKLGASVGICRSRAGKDLKLDVLAERADEALYKVKNTGKNAIAIAEPPGTEKSAEPDTNPGAE